MRAENETETKKRNKDTRNQRNRSKFKLSEASNGHKMEKKTILYFAINRKNCSFYCFQSVFGGASRRRRHRRRRRRVADIAEKVCMWHEARGTRQAMREGKARQQKQGSQILTETERDKEGDREERGGRKGVIAYLAASRWQPSRLPRGRYLSLMLCINRTTFHMYRMLSIA